MKTPKDLYPVEASVLLSSAIEKTLKSEYFPEHGDISCRLNFRSINDTYIVFCNEQEYYFKVYRYGYRTIDEIQAEINLINHLKNNGILTTEPIMKKDGDYIVQFDATEGKRYGVLYSSAGKRYAVLYSSAGAKSSDGVKETDLYNEKLGLYISSIHKAWDKVEYPVNRWRLDLNTFIDNPMNYIRAYTQWYSFDINFLEEVAKKTKERINNIFHKEKPGYGMCHGDFYPGNFRFGPDDNPVLFDFDFCGYGWRSYDISVYLNAFTLSLDSSGIEKRKRRREAFLKGYQRNMPLADIEFDNMYLFVPFRRIFNIGIIYISMSNTFGDNWGYFNLNEDIEILKKWIEYSKF